MSIEELQEVYNERMKKRKNIKKSKFTLKKYYESTKPVRAKKSKANRFKAVFKGGRNSNTWSLKLGNGDRNDM